MMPGNGRKGGANPMSNPRALPPSLRHRHILNTFLIPLNPVPLSSPWGVQSVVREAGRMSSYDLSRHTTLLGIAAHERMNFVPTRVLPTKLGLVFDIRVHVSERVVRSILPIGGCRCSIVVGISACHAGDLCSIPGKGVKGGPKPMSSPRPLTRRIPHHHILNAFLVP